MSAETDRRPGRAERSEATLRHWADGAATGLGPMPGTSYDEAARIVAGELPELPHLPELPARGVGADPVGRAVGILVDLPAEVVPSGWRLARRPGVDQRRAEDQAQWLVDAAEQHYTGADRIKVQVLGPWSLASLLELPSGHRVLTDPAAVDDLAASLLEGLRAHLAELAMRTGGPGLLVQLDEPVLPAVLAGTLPTASGFGTVRSVDVPRVRDLLADLVSGLDVPVVARAAVGSPVDVLREAGFAGIAVDLTRLGGSAAELDPWAETVEAGVSVLAGVIPTAAPIPGTLRGRAAPLLEVWRRWGFPLGRLPGAVVPTPTDGLAGVTAEQALRILRATREIARALADPPDDW